MRGFVAQDTTLVGRVTQDQTIEEAVGHGKEAFALVLDDLRAQRRPR